MCSWDSNSVVFLDGNYFEGRGDESGLLKDYEKKNVDFFGELGSCLVYGLCGFQFLGFLQWATCSSITCSGGSFQFLRRYSLRPLCWVNALSNFSAFAVSRRFSNHLLRRIRFRFYSAVFIFISSMSSTSQFRSFPPFEFPPDVVSSFRLDFISRIVQLLWEWDGDGLAYACGREQCLLRWNCWSSSFE